MSVTDRQKDPKAPAEDSRTLVDDSKTLADSAVAGAVSQAAVTLPDHELLSCIGRGSYGEVWLARNVMGTYRAVKIVYRAAFEHARPFEREFNGIQKFEPISRSHDGFVDVLQIGRTDAYFYYVMELADDVVTGQQVDPATYEPKTLRSQVQAHKPLPFEQCVELGLSLTAALGHLHQHGLIHRDIKPSNIIFVNGIPKLADIGLVAEQSEAKSFVGTEGFIPPEGPGTPQADVYSLGKVLYEISTGKDRHEFPALPTLIGDSSSETRLLELNSVFLTACQADLKLRYDTVGRMREDLLLLQSGRSVRKAQKVERRLVLLTKLSALGLALTIALTTGFVLVQRQARREAKLRLEVQEQLYAADIYGAQAALRDGNLGYARDLISRHGLRQGEPDLRGFEWRYLSALLQPQEVRSLECGQEALFALACSSDGKLLATGGGTHDIKIWEADSGRLVKTLRGHGHRIHRIWFSPDGNTLISGSLDQTIRRWDIAKGTSEILMAGCPVASGQILAISADGQLLVTSNCADGRLRIRDLVSNTDLPTPAYKLEIEALVLSPDKTTIAYSGFADDTPILLWNQVARSNIVLGTHRRLKCMAFSPDGALLATAGMDEKIRVWDARERRKKLELECHDPGLFLSFSPDGKWLASASGDGTAAVWDTATGTNLVVFRGHEQAVSALVFFPDNSRLATAGCEGTVKIWRIAPARTRPSLNTPRSGHFALHPDGRTLALATWPAIPGEHSQVELWDLATKLRTSSFDTGQKVIWQVLYAPDGRSLFTAGLTNVRQWDAETGTFLKTYGPPLKFPHVALAPSGAVLAIGQGRGAGDMSIASDIQIIDTRTGQLLVKLPGHTNAIFNLAFSPDGRRLASTSADKTYKLWDAQSGALLHTSDPMGEWAQAVTFSHDGRLLAACSWGGIVELFDVPNNRVLFRLRAHRGVIFSIAFSADDKTLATGAIRSLTLWHVRTGQRLLTLDEPNETASIVFTPDGRQLLAGGIDSPAFETGLYGTSVYDVPILSEMP